MANLNRIVGLLLAVVAAPALAADPTLVAAYGFNENGGATVLDSSGNSNTGSISGASWTPSGKSGSALSFDGVNDRVFVASSTSLNVTSGVTIEAWVFPTGAQSEWRTVVQKEVDAYFLHASNSSGPLRPAAGGTYGGAVSSFSAPSAIGVNTWTHLAQTYDGSIVRLYVNGVQVASAAHSGALETNNNPLSIGGTAAYGEHFLGRIDDVRIYSRALSVAEIQTDMNTPVDGTPPPPDTQAPTAPTGLSATPVSSTQINLSWTASTDNVAVTNYLIERCTGSGCATFAQIATSGTTTFNNTTLAASTSYSYRVRATDAAGNNSGYSSVASATTLSAPDTQAPTAPSGLSATAVSSTQINLSWTASTDNVAVTNYLVERCTGSGCATFAQIATSGTTTFNNTTLVGSTSYSYRVRATDGAGNNSGYSNTASATTLSAPDTQAPTTPTGLGATAISSTQINLSWTASTDNIGVTGYSLERCAGAGCTTFAEIATPSGTTFNNTGLTAATTYRYRVRATDAAGNLSAYSSIANGTTQAAPDTQAPTTPSGLSATAVSSVQINLSWTGSTDNVGVTNYLIERCTGSGCSTFAQIGTSATTTFNNTSLVASTSYSYRVRATDAAGNNSGYSDAASATTQAGGGVSGLVAAYNFDENGGATVLDSSGNSNTGSVSGASWTPSGKNGPALSFDGSNDRVVVASSSSLNATTALTVEAWVFPTGSQSGWRTVVQKEVDAYLLHASNSAGALRPAAGGTYAGAVSSFSSPSAIAVNTWTHLAQTYDGSIVRLYVNGVQVASAAHTGALETNNNPLSIGGTAAYGEHFLGRIDDVRVYTRALSAGEIQTDMNTPVGGTPPPPDTQAPTAPSGLSATAVSSTQINLSWAGSTDNVGVTNYLIERCTGVSCSTFGQIATASGTTFNNTTVVASTSYSYRVRATDAAGNNSGYSNTASATTPSAPDTQAPTAPSGLSATAISSTQINLSWTGSTDNVGVTNYLIERCIGSGCASFAQIATSATTAFNNTTLVASTSYSYRVRATDAAGNNSGYSNTASATTPSAPDTQAPTAPSGLSATAVSSTQINLGWTASTDNVGVTNYLIERCTGSGCSSFGQIATAVGTTFNNTTVVASTSYSYRVRATDAAGNNSGYSNTASATTPAASDTQAPTAPSGLSATAISSTQINLGWTGSTDNVGVTNYLIERCTGSGCSTFAQIGTSATTTFNNTSLVASTSYSYRVRATDAAGNQSGYSNTASATTQAGGGGAGLAAAYNFDENGGATVLDSSGNSNTGSVSGASWTPSGKNGSALSFDGVNDRVSVASSTSLNATTALTVEAWVFPTGSQSEWRTIVQKEVDAYLLHASNSAGALRPAAGGTYAGAVSSFSSPSAIAVNAWTHLAQTYDGSIVRLYINGVQVASAAHSGSLETNNNPLSIGGTAAYGEHFLGRIDDVRVYTRALSASEIQTDMNTPVGGTPPTDTQAPTAPGALSATPVSSTQINLSWTASTDNVGVTNYLIERCTGAACTTFGQIGTASGTTFNNTGLSASTTYRYRVRATDAAGNLSAYSGIANGTTQAAADTQAPTAPSALSATPISSTQINLSWTGSTDNVGVTNYLIERCTGSGCSSFAQIATSGSTTFNNTNLVASTSYSYRVRATDAAGNNSGYSNTATAATQSAGTLTVSVTAPLDGSTQSGTIALSAVTSGGSAAGVRFQVDGVDIGPADTSSPYTQNLSTNGFANGTHTITARAWDAAGNATTSGGVDVTFSNGSAGNPAATGLWLGTLNWPMSGVHAHVMANGKVLLSDGQSFAGTDAKVWDPATDRFVDVPVADNIFCAGHAALPDGRMFIVGGHVTAHVGIADANIFNPQTNSWTAAPNMQFARWYPTVTPLADGRLLIQSGESNCNGCEVATPEIYNPATNSWTSLPTAAQYFPYYPHTFVLPDGRILVAATTRAMIQSKVLNLATQTWSNIGGAPVDGAASVMYEPGKVLKMGTSTDADAATRAAAATAYVLDANQAGSNWRAVQSMSAPRAYPTATMLPDGKVLVTGGGRTTDAVGLSGSNPVLPAEMWSPDTETWTPLASMHSPRLYHSTAMLLPDARILVTGGGRFFSGPDPTDQLNAEIFVPPYLFRGPRPVIGSAPAQATYGQQFTVATPDAARIDKVVLIRPASVTHDIDMNQGYVPMTFTADANGLSVTAPANGNIAPPGVYMLFLVDDQGVPSVAAFVRL